MPPRKGKPRKSLLLKGNGAFLDLPLDVLLEILKILHPLDLLHLSRTNKALRAFLLDRISAESIWRASFELLEDLPPKCPSYTDEVQWTRLLFEEVCHVCCTPLEHDYSFDPIWWEFGARYCDECCPGQVVERLPKELTGTSSKKLTSPGAARWADVFPRVHGHYLAKDIDLFMQKYSASSSKGDLIQERRNRTKVLTDYARICRNWMYHILNAERHKPKQLIETRWAAIQAKLHEAGWPASLTENLHSYQHDLVNNPRPLTDAEWNRIGPKVTNDFEQDIRGTVVSKRFHTLIRAFPTSTLAKLTQHFAFAPRIVDIALLPDVRAVLEGDLKSDMTVNDLKTALEPKLPDLLAAWSSALETQLRDYTRAALELPTDSTVDPLEYALAYFVCEKRCCKGHFKRTGDAQPCRTRWWERGSSETSDYEQEATRIFNCKPCTVNAMFRIEPGLTVLPDVIKLYGKDPKTATCAEMDAAPEKLWCMRCVLKNQPQGWRDAVPHSMMFHEKFSALKPRWEVEIETDDLDPGDD